MIGSDLTRWIALAFTSGFRRAALLTSRRRIMHAALGLTVVGWTALWAEALALTHLLPLWADALLFFSGLGLIPLGEVAAAPSISGDPVRTSPRSKCIHDEEHGACLTKASV